MCREGDSLTFQRNISVLKENMAHAFHFNAELKESWIRLTSTNTELRAQLTTAVASGTMEQQASTVRIDEDRILRRELAACLARESTLEERGVHSRNARCSNLSRTTFSQRHIS